MAALLYELFEKGCTADEIATKLDLILPAVDAQEIIAAFHDAGFIVRHNRLWKHTPQGREIGK